MNKANRTPRRHVRWPRWPGGWNAVTWLFLQTLVLFASFSTASAAMPDPPSTGANAPQAVIPSNEWVNFYSAASYLHGELVPVGAVVAAYDSTGVQAGEFTVTQSGWYGVMPVYRDDPNTPEDEGLSPGEEVRFTIDGVAARAAGPIVPSGRRTAR